MICSVAWEKITYNVCIDATKLKLNMATALGLWYVQIPYGFVISQKEEVVKVKETCAFLIDYLQGYKNSISVLPENQILNPKEFNEKYAETFRAIATAQTKIEDAAMWAVKAVTK